MTGVSGIDTGLVLHVLIGSAAVHPPSVGLELDRLERCRWDRWDSQVQLSCAPL